MNLKESREWCVWEFERRKRKGEMVWLNCNRKKMLNLYKAKNSPWVDKEHILIQTSYFWTKIFIKCHKVDFLLNEAGFVDNTYFNTYFGFSSNSVNWMTAKWTLASITWLYPFWFVLCGKQPCLSNSEAANFNTVTDSITVCMSIFVKWQWLQGTYFHNGVVFPGFSVPSPFLPILIF